MVRTYQLKLKKKKICDFDKNDDLRAKKHIGRLITKGPISVIEKQSKLLTFFSWELQTLLSEVILFKASLKRLNKNRTFEKKLIFSNFGIS
jgi:hypothetical protein